MPTKSRARPTLTLLARRGGHTIEDIARECDFSETQARTTVAQLVRDGRASGSYLPGSPKKVYECTALGRTYLQQRAGYVPKGDKLSKPRPVDLGQPCDARTALVVPNSVFQLAQVPL